MTYENYIQDLIDKRGQWNIPENTYFEGHHIIPECLGGTGNSRKKDPNIIWLYPEEHFIAHKLLAEENPDNESLVLAWSMMMSISDSHKRDYEVTAEDYAKARLLVSQLKGTKIICIETQEIFNSIESAIRKYQNKNIAQVITGKRATAAGYHWAKLNDIDKIESLKRFIGKGPIRKVICIEDNREFNTTTEAAKYYQIERSNISYCLKNEHRAGGYHWAYANDIDKINKFANNKQMTAKDLAIEHGNRVICIELNEIFYSQKEAARIINQRYGYKISGSNIKACCVGKRKTTAGFHWRYIK